MRKKILKMSSKWDGNAFAVMGNTQEALRDAGVEQVKISQVLDECMKGDYSNLLAVCVGALTDAGYEVR